MFHLNNWLFYTEEENDTIQFHTNVVPKHIDISKAMVEATDAVFDISEGKKIALCLSGGYDSQLTFNCLKSCGLDFDVFIFDYEGENWQDQQRAKMFAQFQNESFIVLSLKVETFLEEEFERFVDIGLTSPQMMVHCKMFEKIKSLGYETIVIGGDVLTKHEGVYNFNLDSSRYLDHRLWAKHTDTKLIRFLELSSDISFYFARGQRPYLKEQTFSKTGFPFIACSSTGFTPLQKKMSEQTNVLNFLDVTYRNYARKHNKYMYCQNRYILHNGEKVYVTQHRER